MLKKTLLTLAILAIVAPAFGQAVRPVNTKAVVGPQAEVQEVGEPQLIVAPNPQKREIKRNTLRANFTSQVEARKMEMETKMEAFEAKTQARKAILGERLKNISDEAKAKAVERIDVNLEKVNEKVIARYNAFLIRLEDVLARIADKTDEVEADGIDVADVRAAITAASTAIANAHRTVDTQTVKVYELAIDTEDNLGSVVSTVRFQLRDDLKNVREIVRVAAVEVSKAGKALRPLIVVNDEPEVTEVEE